MKSDQFFLRFLFFAVASLFVSQTAVAQSFTPGINQQLIPLNTKLGCLFATSDSLVSTALVRLGDTPEEYGDAVEFGKAIRRRRAKSRRLRAKVELSRSLGDVSRAANLQTRFLRVRGLTREMRACRNVDARIGDAKIAQGVTLPIKTQGIPRASNPNDACAVVGGSQSGFITRIINGDRCVQSDSPVLELLMYRQGRLIEACSGTAIGDRVILTAAHCAVGIDLAVVRAQGQAIFSSEIHPHPNYNENGFVGATNDVALIRTRDILPVKKAGILGDGDRVLVGEQLLIAGFGLIDAFGTGVSDGVTTDGLRAGFMNVSLVTEEEIRANFELTQGGANTCNGDSGGPALVRGQTTWHVAGIVSYGFNTQCGPSDVSGFTNITSASVQNHIFTYAHFE